MTRSVDRAPSSLEVGLRPSGSLVDRAIARLSTGPAATLTLAEDILALRGNPRAAAAAVYALLGSDPRVRVDRSGVWSLTAPPDETVGAIGSLAETNWVVVDVETTGGSPAHGHRIIEIAAVEVAGGEIVGEYSSLVNPGRPIPRMITSLTGIANDMVVDAPTFEEIAPRVTDVLGGRVFVAHNASFDWRFVCSELERCTGQTLTGNRLCTLRLARRLLPNLPSRSLGALADYHGIAMDTHHRALDDAVATARLLVSFLDRLAALGVADWESLGAYFRAPAPRRRRSARPAPMDSA